jgi:hypothetical protein
MPAFQSLGATKRKHEEDGDEITRKRVSTGTKAMSLGGQDEAWMVQWYPVQIPCSKAKY